MKKVVTDNRLNYVHYTMHTGSIFGTYLKLSHPLASIEDVKNHYEIWDCPLMVKEGHYKYENGEYVKH